MDCFSDNKKSNQRQKRLRGLTERVRLLEQKITATRNERHKESRAHERDMMVFAFKEAEWKQERKRFEEEVKRLRKAVEEKEERIREMEEAVGFAVGEKISEKDLQVLGTTTCLLVEHMKEERAMRDEAMNKWKKHYFAIKTELDDLIQKTHRGDGIYWRAEEEDVIQGLKMEVKAKEETMEELTARLAFAEQEGYRKAREVDILRQSLRITSGGSSSQKALSSFALGKPMLSVLRGYQEYIVAVQIHIIKNS